MMRKRKNKLVTADEVIEMVGIILQFHALQCRGECECTIHRRTGDILDVCESCSAGVQLYEIRQDIMSRVDALAEGGE